MHWVFAWMLPRLVRKFCFRRTKGLWPRAGPRFWVDPGSSSIDELLKDDIAELTLRSHDPDKLDGLASGVEVSNRPPGCSVRTLGELWQLLSSNSSASIPRRRSVRSRLSDVFPRSSIRCGLGVSVDTSLPGRSNIKMPETLWPKSLRPCSDASPRAAGRPSSFMQPKSIELSNLRVQLLRLEQHRSPSHQAVE